MKTNSNNTGLKGNMINMVLSILIGIAPMNLVNGQQKQVFTHDYLMPRKGQSMLEAYSGIPYVAIGQYAYGFSNRVSVGVVYGYTPFVKGYGLRVKAVIAQPSESFRLYVKSPFLYYPKTKEGDGEPWVLTWPSINGEWKLKNGARFWAGAGVIGAGCYNYIFRREAEMKKHEEMGHHPEGGHTHGEGHPLGENVPQGEDVPQGEPEMMAGIWNTFQFGYSKPISKKMSFVAEIAPVMEGFKLKSKQGFLDTAPVIVTVGLSYSF